MLIDSEHVERNPQVYRIGEGPNQFAQCLNETVVATINVVDVAVALFDWVIATIGDDRRILEYPLKP